MVFQPSASPFFATNLHALAASSKAPQLLLDSDLNVIAASASFCKAFKIDSANAAGCPLIKLGAGEWNVPQLLSLLKLATSGAAEIEGYEMALSPRDRVARRLILHAKRLQYGEEPRMWLRLSISDVTDAHIAEQLKEDLALERRVSRRTARHITGGGTLSTSREALAFKVVGAELRRKLEDQNQELVTARADRRKALDTAQARTSFLTNTSHELRTPLNAILGFSEILTKEMFGPLANDRYREYAEIIHKSGSHLLNLVNDLLDLSKLDIGTRR